MQDPQPALLAHLASRGLPGRIVDRILVPLRDHLAAAYAACTRSLWPEVRVGGARRESDTRAPHHTTQTSRPKWPCGADKGADMNERREYGRFTISVPVRMTFACPFGEVATLTARTRNISEEGVTVEIAASEDPRQVTPYAWDKMPVELAIILPKDYTVHVTARLVWHRLEADDDECCFEGGLLLTGMTDEDRTVWEQFIAHVAVMEPTGRGHGTCASNHDASTR